MDNIRFQSVCFQPFFQVICNSDRIFRGETNGKAVFVQPENRAQGGGFFKVQCQFPSEIGKNGAVLPVQGSRFCLSAVAVIVEFVQYPFPFFDERVFNGMDRAPFRSRDPKSGFVDDESDRAPAGTVQEVGNACSVQIDGSW